MFPHSTSLYDFEFVYSYNKSLFEFVYSYDNIFKFVYGYVVRGSDFDYNYSGLGFEFGDRFTLKGISNCYSL